MNAMQQGVITLLKSAVTGEKLDLPEGFDLEAAYPELKKHNMDALLYEGAVRCGISKQLPVMQQLFRKSCLQLMTVESQQRKIRELFEAFEANGIEYLPLKGCRMRGLYPKPALRYMGDADILIRQEQYDRIAPVMDLLGFVDKGESDHEIKWKNPELYVELHKHLIPSYNEDFYRYYGSGWQLAAHREGCCWTMKPEDEWIFLVTHFAKHFRDGGIGCRYVLDLWMFRRHHQEMDEAYIGRELEKLKLWEFHDNVRRLIRIWFENLSADSKADAMTEYIFASGSWGVAVSKAVSVAVRDSRRSEQAKEEKLKYLLRIAFPSVDMLKDKYTILKTCPWLLPVVWVIRPFYKLLWERKSLLRHRENLRSLTEEKLDERRALLRMLGIDFHL